MKQNIFALVLLALLAGATARAGQSAAQPTPSEPAQPGVTFRAEVNYVEVDARVIDAQGRFVPGLAPGDFEIDEDGRPQKVTVFSLVNLPVERAPRPLFAERPIEPDVQTNLSGYNGRVYLLVLDDLHTHPLRSNRVKGAARQFIERYMGANDVAAVVHTSGRSDSAQDFTSNPRLLTAAVDKFMGRKLRSATLNRIDQEIMTRGQRQTGDRIDDIDEAERGFNARNTLDSLKNFSEVMAGVRGRRKALVYFSEGIDYDINDVFNNRDATTIIDSTRDAIAAATRANVSIYGIDVRGLGAAFDNFIDVQSFPEDTTLGLNSSALQNETRLGQDSLRVLGDETGGFAAVNTNDIEGAFRRVVEENSSYYVLGYYPTNDRRDGRFRRIEVRVKKPGLTVRARRGYVAPRGRASEVRLAGPNDASSELRDAMSSPIPVSGLPLAATASVFKGPDRKATIVVSTLIGGRDLPLVEREGTFRNDIEVAIAAVDAKGKLFTGDRNTVNMNLKPDTVPRVRTAGFRVISALDVPPGRYQLRVAAREANARRAGSVLYDIEVPDFAREPLSMSSLALTSQTSGLAPTARPKDPLAKLLPGPLSSYRDFGQADEVAVFAEVYEASATPAHKVEIVLTVKAEGGQTVFQTREQRDSSELGGNSGGYGFTARIPLRDFTPGLHVLRVEAQSQVGDRPAVARETVINVVASPGASPTPAATPDRTAPAAPAARREPQGDSKVSTVAPENRTAPTAPSAPVSFTSLNNDAMSGIDRGEQVVVRTQAEWESLWRRHAAGRPVPSVDFSREMVVGVFLGSRPSGGFSVQITGVSRAGDQLVVTWSERSPAAGQLAAQVMTAPSHLVTVPRHDGQVRFERAGQ
jgi:VWFA-related protein